MTTEKLRDRIAQWQRLVEEAGVAIAPAVADVDADMMFAQMNRGLIEVHFCHVPKTQAVCVVKGLGDGWTWEEVTTSRWQGQKGNVVVVIDIYGVAVMSGRKPLVLEGVGV